MSKAFYVPWLHMHQPLVWLEKYRKWTSNLKKMLLSSSPRESWDAKLMARAYKNPAKFVRILRKAGYKPKIILDFSGILLESLEEFSKDGTFDRIEVEGERIGDVIKLYKEVMCKFPDSIEIAGSAYSHCYFPATPEDDWLYQLQEWKEVFRRIFGRNALKRVRGFWLPELGLPGFEDKLHKLIEVLIEVGYEWLILPLQALEGYENLSYEEKIKMACQPHLLKVRDLTFPIIFRFPSDIIDQQAGCEASELVKRVKQTARIFSKFSKKPALIVPASDGENGNVMMNEFFPKTFVPFFSKEIDEISSLTVSEFLDRFYGKEKLEVKSEIKVKTIGASWVDGHKFWLEGTRRLEMVRKIQKLSQRFHDIEKKARRKGLKKMLDEARKALLIAETSCYVYWGTDFWFDQGEKAIGFTLEKLRKLEKYL